MSVRSVSDALGGEPVLDNGEQPPPCFTGLHTTDVDAVKEQHKSVDVLEDQMKHRVHFESLDRRAKYDQIDTGDDGRRWRPKYFGGVDYMLEQLL